LCQSLDERFVDGLRQRQLLPLAERFCRVRLARADLSDARRAELSIELSRCLTEEALLSSPEGRDAFWRQALEAVEQFGKQFPASGRLIQVRVQRGLVEVTWGELLVQEAETTRAGPNAVRLSAARDLVRAAIEEVRAAAA
jgi:hypothetical protein